MFILVLAFFSRPLHFCKICISVKFSHNSGLKRSLKLNLNERLIDWPYPSWHKIGHFWNAFHSQSLVWRGLTSSKRQSSSISARHVLPVWNDGGGKRLGGGGLNGTPAAFGGPTGNVKQNNWAISVLKTNSTHISITNWHIYDATARESIPGRPFPGNLRIPDIFYSQIPRNEGEQFPGTEISLGTYK